MPRNIRIISCPDFIRHDVHGSFDADATRASLKQIAVECSNAGLGEALLDVREISDAPSISELFWIADELPSLGFPPQLRLAIVYVDRQQGRATFFANAAHNHGFSFREFTTFEAAFAWLSIEIPTDGMT